MHEETEDNRGLYQYQVEVEGVGEAEATNGHHFMWQFVFYLLVY